MCEEYLLKYHKADIINVLNETDSSKHYPIYINFIELFENDPQLGTFVLNDPDTALEDWNRAITKVQLKVSKNKDVVLKKCHCRLHSLPVCPELVRTKFPTNVDTGKFLELSGTVVRTTTTKLLELERKYVCTKCKYSITVKADYEQKHLIIPPKKCPNPDNCKNTNLIHFGGLDSEYCIDYQEIRIQEPVTKLGMGSIPSSMWVTLDNDLVDNCKPGDNITVCGIVKQRWEPLIVGKKTDIEIVFKANFIQVNNAYGSASVTPEIKAVFTTFWDTYSQEPLVGRDIILKSICSQLFGLYFVKLATALVLAGGTHVDDKSSTGVRVRSESHLLLVGDPGTGKSHLLRFASKIIPRSVLTTGIGSTAAGLTVTAVKENGEWQLEGGALVLADGGICCIDEFNSMRDHDRTSIHEAMEQQTISVAKASIVCKLSTRCSILAACNPKGNLDPTQPLSLNIALASPLLSRFDLILLLRDTVNEEWDNLVSDYILNGEYNYSKLTENNMWSLDLLQAYFKIIRKLTPMLTEESNVILSRYYQCQRKIDNRNKSRTTVRLLDSLIRLSQGHAKLMYHDSVQIMDAVFAIILVDTAMQDEGRILNLNLTTHSTFSENPMGDYLEMLEIILTKLNLPELYEMERQNLRNAGKHKGTRSRFFNKASTSKQNLSPNIDGCVPIDENIVPAASSTQIKDTDVEDITQKSRSVQMELDFSDPIISDEYTHNTSADQGNASEGANDSNPKKVVQNSKTILKTCDKNEHINSPLVTENADETLNSSRHKLDKTTSINNSELNTSADAKVKSLKPTRRIGNIESKSKKIKLDNNIVDDLKLLNYIPSVNDDIMNMNLNFDYDCDIDFRSEDDQKDELTGTVKVLNSEIKDINSKSDNTNNQNPIEIFDTSINYDFNDEYESNQADSNNINNEINQSKKEVSPRFKFKRKYVINSKMECNLNDRNNCNIDGNKVGTTLEETIPVLVKKKSLKELFAFKPKEQKEVDNSHRPEKSDVNKFKQIPSASSFIEEDIDDIDFDL